MQREDLDHRLSWLRLASTPGVGRHTARQLLAHFGAPAAIFAQSVQALQALVGPDLAQALQAPPPSWDSLEAALVSWLQGDASRELLTLDDPRYPAPLLQTADPPNLLYAQGDLAWLSRPCLAVVGSRNPTAQGADHARAFAQALTERGYTIVSGMALGIDALAHQAALDVRATARERAGALHASTIAVVGTGLDRIYPARHEALARRIVAEGLMLSEFPLGTHPLAENFPQRNRIIAGLSAGTLVVEAALQSGSLITAQQALEAGREVFAIPGSIHSPQSHGCHALIRQGAKLVESAQDIADELVRQELLGPPATTGSADINRAPAEPKAVAPPSPWQPLLDAMGYEPLSLDEVLARTGWPASTAQAQLLELELQGLVARLPGGRLQRRASA